MATASRLSLQRVFAMDEARFGLKVTHRRLWCPFGSRPPYVHDHEYKWFWLYAAVDPLTGDCFVLFLPHVDGVWLERFLTEFRKQIAEDRVGLVMDGSGSHKCGAVDWPPGVHKILLPSYSPELNPAERWFEALRRVLANKIFDTLQDLEEALSLALQPYWDEPAKLQRLVGYPWWCISLRRLTSVSAASP